MQSTKKSHAGRKPLADSAKKKGYKIYMTDDLANEIEYYGQGTTFSSKCSNFLKNQLEYQKNKDSKTIKIIDLFAGLGGIRLGVEQAFAEKGYNVECVLTSEIKKHATSAYKKFFNDNVISGDITKIKNANIPDFDILLAGFPCQPFSSAGKGLGFNDTRGTLFFEIERILEAKKPQGFLLENVEGLVNHDKGRTLNIIINQLEKLDYNVSWTVLDAQNFGLAQSRRRIYIVGSKFKNVDIENFKPEKSALKDILQNGLPTINNQFTQCLFNHYSADEILGKSIKDKRGGKNNIHSWDIELKGKVSKEQNIILTTMLTERRKKTWAEKIGIQWMDGMPLTANQIATFIDFDNLKEMLDDLVDKGYLKFEHPKKLVNKTRVYDYSKPKGYNIVAGKLSFYFTKILHPEEVTPTLVAMDVSKLGVVDGNGVRRLTIREGMRLCGYPENYDISFLNEKEAFDLLGNTVCIPVIKQIALRLGDCIVKNRDNIISIY